jgi:hypothetical protein
MRNLGSNNNQSEHFSEGKSKTVKGFNKKRMQVGVLDFILTPQLA